MDDWAEALSIGAMLLIFLVFFALAKYSDYRERRLDAAVRFTEADFLHSEFPYSKTRFRATLLFAAVCAGLTGWILIKEDGGLITLTVGGGITALSVGIAYYRNRHRVVFDDWSLIFYRGEKPLWKLHMSELDRITRYYVDDVESHIVLRTETGRRHQLVYHTFQDSRKLRMMLSDPQRAFEDAVPSQP